jgi:hypothetical protein
MEKHRTQTSLNRGLVIVGDAAKQALSLVVAALLVEPVEYPKEYQRAQHDIW